MEEKPNYYAVIPANVRYDERLRANEKLLYGEITALTNKTGECWASNNYFAKLYDVTPRAITKWIKDLSDRGHISVEYEYKDKLCVKRIIKPKGVLTNVLGGTDKCSRGYSQKFQDNNTSNNIYIVEIVNYLNSVSGKKFSSSTLNTKKHINARLSEGFSVEDFKKVIDTKYDEWSGTDMAKFIRPDTLFGTKFESYLNQSVDEDNSKGHLIFEDGGFAIR